MITIALEITPNVPTVTSVVRIILDFRGAASSVSKLVTLLLSANVLFQVPFQFVVVFSTLPMTFLTFKKNSVSWCQSSTQMWICFICVSKEAAVLGQRQQRLVIQSSQRVFQRDLRRWAGELRLDFPQNLLVDGLHTCYSSWASVCPGKHPGCQLRRCALWKWTVCACHEL